MRVGTTDDWNRSATHLVVLSVAVMAALYLRSMGGSIEGRGVGRAPGARGARGGCDPKVPRHVLNCAKPTRNCGLQRAVREATQDAGLSYYWRHGDPSVGRQQ